MVFHLSFFSKRKWIALIKQSSYFKQSICGYITLFVAFIHHSFIKSHPFFMMTKTKQPRKDCFLISDCHCSFRAICHHLCCISLMKVNLRTKQSRTSMIHAVGPFSVSSTPHWLHCRICLQGKDKVRMGFLFPLGEKKLYVYSFFLSSRLKIDI